MLFRSTQPLLQVNIYRVINVQPARVTAREGWPASPDDLQHHACLGFRYPLDGRFLRWGFINNGQHTYAALNVTATSDDIDALAQMAAHGAGIARLAEFIAAPYIESGQLIPLLQHSHSPTESYTKPLDIYACVQDRAAICASASMSSLVAVTFSAA